MKMPYKSYPGYIAVASIIALGSAGLGAVVGIHWMKSEVTPVILVKPGIGGFEPEDGSAIGNTWSKSEVKPVLLVKPGLAGFEPREGSTIGMNWTKDDVIPVLLVEPADNAFRPSHLLSDSVGNATVQGSTRLSSTDAQSKENTPSVIESQIDGTFEGWTGETVFKLINGQIWEQSEYDYSYQYMFMPKVLIYKTSGGFKMKVDGAKKSIGVKRLK